jgi:RNA polymerase sigma factor (TIGR02999 family)
MTTSSPNEVTQLLIAWSEGDESALGKLAPLVEAELHRLAHNYLQRERAGHTLQTTALINEAYLRLIDWRSVEWKSRAHFFGVAADFMRKILVDHARHRQRSKRGGDAIRVSLSEADKQAAEINPEVIEVHESLERLAQFDPLQSQIVVLRYFGGLRTEEIAAVLKIAPRKVEREWRSARAWLFKELSGK